MKSTVRGILNRWPAVGLAVGVVRNGSLEVRGTVVEMTEAGAAEHLDDLASTYAGRPIRYFGDAIPARFAQTEVPVLCRIRPSHVVALDATGKEPRP
jgi:hypothetical protein